MKTRRTNSTGPFFTATQLAAALGMSRIQFFGFAPQARKSEERSYGKVLVFAHDKLPDELRELLRSAKIEHRCASIEELVRFRLQERRRPAVAGLFRQRLAPGPKALIMRAVVNRYLAEMDSGKSERESNILARAEFEKRFRRKIGECQIRRLAAKVTHAGGPELAPIDAYADHKSVSHARGGGRQTNHGAAATAAARRQLPGLTQ